MIVSKGEEKVYKLLVELEFQVPKSYRRYLKPYEVVRGEIVKVKFYVTNIGEEKFPGGGPSLIEMVEYGSSIGLGRLKYVLPQDKLSEMRLPELEKEQRHLLGEGEFIPGVEGFGEISVRINANDDGKVLHFRSTEALEGEDTWRFPFVIVNRESLLTLILLEKLTKKKKG